jgi:hypothetical protein
MSLKTSTTASSYRRGRRFGAAASVIAVAALALTACGGNSGSDNASSGSSSTPAASSAAGSSGSSGSSGSATGSGSGSGSQTGSGSGSGSSAQSGSGSGSTSGDCSADNLSLKLSYSNAGAGNIYENLVFTNKGSSTCTLAGYPGVSLIQGDGSQIGSPATRDGSSVHSTTVSLAPGGSAHAVLHTLNQGVKANPPCWTKAAFVKVYAPGSKTVMTATASDFQVCGGEFTTTPVQAGAS